MRPPANKPSDGSASVSTGGEHALGEHPQPLQFANASFTQFPQSTFVPFQLPGHADIGSSSDPSTGDLPPEVQKKVIEQQIKV